VQVVTAMIKKGYYFITFEDDD